MSFVTLGALLVALLVGAPVAAHLLRRRRAEERPFPPARLVPPAQSAARRRSLLEDRALFATRALSVLALAILGATPLLRCSHLSLSRKAGASVALAIVLDDSLSMRARQGAGGEARPRFERALAAARELAGGLAPGDAAAVVLAGAPARVALASTTNLAAVAEALSAVAPSDRATDLDGALDLARELLQGLPQRDKRIVLLSDLADGAPDAPPITSGPDVATWVPLKELEASGDDCGIVRADRAGQKVRVRVVCTAAQAAAPEADGASPAPGGTASSPAPGSTASSPAPGGTASSPAAGRSLEVRADGAVLGTIALDPGLRAAELSVELPPDAPEILTAVLTGSDAIAEDDRAPIISAGGPPSVAVVVDTTSAHVETGGPPPLEQALSALELDAQIRPLPSVPEHEGELGAYAGLIVDDAPGFTPEARRSLAAWVERGGVVLLTLGPRAAAAPLGAGFEPLVPGVVRWSSSPVPGIDPATAGWLGPSSAGLADVAPRGRTTLDPKATEGAEVLARWRDGAPFLVRRPLGRGVVLLMTLPLSTEESDVVLRPAFLSLLDGFVGAARARGGARRIAVGETWTFDGYHDVKVDRVRFDRDAAGPAREPLSVAEVDGRLRVSPGLAGLYEVALDGDRGVRVVSIPEREIDLRPRRVAESARSAELGGMSATIDASPYVALVLLSLLAAELLLRALGGRRERAAARSP